MTSPELLIPAGSLEKLRYACLYGADAVYAGVPIFSLRARENEFTFEDLEKGAQLIHSMGKKIYLTANIFARNLKIKSFTEHIDKAVKLKPDALIMGDPGLISIVRERHPDVPIHLSVQANCMNWKAVEFWKNQGISRIILSRELRLTEIQQIHEMVPDIELEAFVHGSICIAYSGRCLLSHYMSYRDANQGVCDNSCRYPYKLYKENGQDEEFVLNDPRNPSEYYPIEEDEHGTYIMNANDLCLVEHLKELRDAGVCSFKVEGRTKSVYYAAMISKVYRNAIDDMMTDKPFNPKAFQELSSISNRGFNKGFLMGEPSQDGQDLDNKNKKSSSAFLGIIENTDVKHAKVDVRGKVSVGDRIEIVSPNEVIQTSVLNIKNLRGDEKLSVHSGSGLWQMEFKDPVTAHSFLRTPVV